mmetsp:Transcript_4522/g.14050  ORF Transcript_4522/g.14050 Transcript_4522/m.14050 type:complete len:140 (-) Transcript_4522:807-1226(-)
MPRGAVAAQGPAGTSVRAAMPLLITCCTSASMWKGTGTQTICGQPESPDSRGDVGGVDSGVAGQSWGPRELARRASWETVCEWSQVPTEGCECQEMSCSTASASCSSLPRPRLGAAGATSTLCLRPNGRESHVATEGRS